MRINAKWSNRGRVRSPIEIAGALAFTGWKIAASVVLNLENEGFETQSQTQRLQVITEIMCFMVSVVDRMVYNTYSIEQRGEFVTTFALSLGNILEDNHADIDGPGNYRKAFIEQLNLRASEYAECSYSTDEGASFPMRRILGNHVMDAMGDKDRKWIPDYIIDVEAPNVVATLKRALPSLFS